MNKHITKFDFKNLFVLDLANNHQGNLKHGLKIINSCLDVLDKHKLRGVIKFQFRDLPNFVHVQHRAASANKHAPRFLSTALSWSEFGELHASIKTRNYLSMCTPFDEVSVNRIVQMGFDLIKIASCSAKDWPLIQKISESNLPIIASTGGLTQAEVDDLVSFLTHRGCDFALMHCVSIYPTPDYACHLGNIAGFRDRYPGITIGWSTHEPPEDLIQIGLASALGANMFERHVGLESEKYKLNPYSSSPEQVDAWLLAWKNAQLLIGDRNRGEPLEVERTAIEDLGRGVFAQKNIAAGLPLGREQVYFAFPISPGQISSGEWSEEVLSRIDLEADAPLMKSQCEIPADNGIQIIKNAIHEVKALLAYARVTLSHEFTTEYSHHYGVVNFRKIGAVLISVINREYAKKVIVQLPGQMHPWHFHKLKEETFVIIWGELISELGDRQKTLKPGDTLTVLPGVWHRFWTETGCVFEEISTTAFSDDSVYRDPEINKLTSAQRKTQVDHWGRFQLKEQLQFAALPLPENTDL